MYLSSCMRGGWLTTLPKHQRGAPCLCLSISLLPFFSKADVTSPSFFVFHIKHLITQSSKEQSRRENSSPCAERHEGASNNNWSVKNIQYWEPLRKEEKEMKEQWGEQLIRTVLITSKIFFFETKHSKMLVESIDLTFNCFLLLLLLLLGFFYSYLNYVMGAPW